jgi:hypothetical protein
VPPEQRARGTANGSAKLDDDRVREIRRRSAEGATQTALARQFGVSQPLIGQIIRRAAWAHVE